MAYLQSIEIDWTTWKILKAGSAASATTYYLQQDLQYVPFLIAPNSNTFPDGEAIYFVGVNRDPSASGPYAALSSGIKALLHLQDITYTANDYGTGGNSITLQYVNDATAVGKEYVTVVGPAITVHIVSGQSTAQQVLTAALAWNAYSGLSSYHSAAASHLVSGVIDAGKEGIAQVTVGATPLATGTAAVTVLYDWENNYLSSGTRVACFAEGVALEVA